MSLTQDEKDAQDAANNWKLLGAASPAVGTLAGAGIGALIGLAGGPAAEITVPAGIAIGGAVGGLGSAGAMAGASGAEQHANQLAVADQASTDRELLQKKAIDELLGKYQHYF